MNHIKYLKIPYLHRGCSFEGCDCLGLVRLFYKEEMGILLKDTEYEEDWYSAEPRRIIQNYKYWNFKKVADSPQIGDVLLIAEDEYPKHLGVVCQDGYFLHTLKAGTACHSYKQGYYLQKVQAIYRHKELKC